MNISAYSMQHAVAAQKSLTIFIVPVLPVMLCLLKTPTTAA